MEKKYENLQQHWATKVNHEMKDLKLYEPVKLKFIEDKFDKILTKVDCELSSGNTLVT
jgi:hypothetical protein